MIFHFIPDELFLHPPHNWKPHHHSCLFCFPQSVSFLVHLIPCVSNFLRILFELIAFLPPHSAALALLLLLDLLLYSTLLPMEYIPLCLNILCFHCTLPFYFTQNHPCLLPALMEFVVFALCFILGHSSKGVILTV